MTESVYKVLIKSLMFTKYMIKVINGASRVSRGG